MTVSPALWLSVLTVGVMWRTWVFRLKVKVVALRPGLEVERSSRTASMGCRKEQRYWTVTSVLALWKWTTTTSLLIWQMRVNKYWRLQVTCGVVQYGVSWCVRCGVGQTGRKWYNLTYFGRMLTVDPSGREKRWASSPRMRAWYLTGLEDGLFSRTCRTDRDRDRNSILQTTQTQVYKTAADRQTLLSENTNTMKCDKLTDLSVLVCNVAEQRGSLTRCLFVCVCNPVWACVDESIILLMCDSNPIIVCLYVWSHWKCLHVQVYLQFILFKACV